MKPMIPLQEDTQPAEDPEAPYTFEENGDWFVYDPVAQTTVSLGLKRRRTDTTIDCDYTSVVLCGLVLICSQK